MAWALVRLMKITNTIPTPQGHFGTSTKSQSTSKQSRRSMVLLVRVNSKQSISLIRTRKEKTRFKISQEGEQIVASVWRMTTALFSEE